jgi:hypothetical protein
MATEDPDAPRRLLVPCSVGRRTASMNEMDGRVYVRVNIWYAVE